MPSGPKKRKANKKKKENRSMEGYGASSSVENPSHGEDVKQQETRGDNLNVRAKDSCPSLSADEKERNHLNLSSDELRFDGGGNHKVEEETVIPIERGFKIENETDTINGKVNDKEEAARKSYNGVGSFSSGGRNHAKLNSQAEVDVASVADSVKVPDSLSRSSADAVHGLGSGNPVAGIAPVAYSIEQVELDHAAGNGERELFSVDEKVNTSEPHKNAPASEWEDKAVVYLVDNTATVSTPNKTRENDVGLSVSYNAAIVDGTEEEKDFVANEHLLAPSRYPVEKSSWKSCCGLFEVFSRSSA